MSSLSNGAKSLTSRGAGKPQSSDPQPWLYRGVTGGALKTPDASVPALETLTPLGWVVAGASGVFKAPGGVPMRGQGFDLGPRPPPTFAGGLLLFPAEEAKRSELSGNGPLG